LAGGSAISNEGLLKMSLEKVLSLVTPNHIILGFSFSSRSNSYLY